MNTCRQWVRKNSGLVIQESVRSREFVWPFVYFLLFFPTSALCIHVYMIHTYQRFWNQSTTLPQLASTTRLLWLQRNPLGQLHLSKLRPLKVLILPLTGWGCYFKCLTHYWNDSYKERPFCENNRILFVSRNTSFVQEKVSVWNHFWWVVSAVASSRSGSKLQTPLSNSDSPFHCRLPATNHIFQSETSPVTIRVSSYRKDFIIYCKVLFLSYVVNHKP